MSKKIRWQQRFENLEQAFLKLKEGVIKTEYTELERAGLIQYFEFTFELSWKTMKDFLESEGFAVTSPRDTLKQAFQSGYIKEGKKWMEALEDRNLTTHTYDEKSSRKIETLIKTKYFSMIEELYERLKQESTR